MTNVMRKRWDFKANPAWILEFPVDANVGVEIGDLMWLDTDDAKPASSTSLWTGTLAGTRGKLAEKFLGVAMSSHGSTDPAGTVRVACRGVFALPVTTATTFEVGDRVSGSRDGSNNYLLDQEVEKAADSPANQNIFIGKAVKRYSSNTSIVEVEIAGSVVAGGGMKAFLSS